MKMRLIMAALCLCCLASAGWSADYRIGEGDSLAVAVWGVPELSGTVVVRPDGKITLPAAGDVVAGGFTPTQLGKELAKVLVDYVKSPIVTVTVTGITNNRVYISGGGVPSQVLNLPGRSSLFKLLCGIEGIAQTDLQRAYLIRTGQRLPVDMHDLFNNGNLAVDIELQAEDILFLPTNERNKIYVVGAVATPQAIPYRDGLRILDVILESGGFTKFAKASGVLILRKTDEDGQAPRTTLRLNMDSLMKDGQLDENIAMQRGDYVIVREGLF
ncbi:polysaccharide biosynthesis/export family protein [Desulfuromonas thiophila]|uniref:polysaccharide biosynthesis/export family protein n=1 Tax=Desulfuromonas thiophila TaxID=57664 RepID=UPI0024A93E5A|nr:polysaccharide biosynthesis/export family protein [Desulfuromonas thiophila]